MNEYKLGFLFLGAGSSSRMLGDDKLLKKVNGVTQIQKILLFLSLFPQIIINAKMQSQKPML